MLDINEGQYPILMIQFTGVVTLQDTEIYLSHLEKWLSLARPFGISISQSIIETPDPKQAQEGHMMVVRWTKQHKPQMSQYCQGMAMVVESPELLIERQASVPKVTNALFGCPGQAFATLPEAWQWLSTQIQQ